MGWMVMLAVLAIKEYFAATAMGTPIECPPPRTSETVGFDMLAIISAMARPASTSPPTVLSIIKTPFDFCRLFEGDQLGNDMLVLCGFVLGRKHQVSFNLTDNSKTVDVGFNLRHG